MNATSILKAINNYFTKNESGTCLRTFEIFFTTSFLVYMLRNLLTPLEWLTSYGFHLTSDIVRSNNLDPAILLPTWGIPIYIVVLLTSATGVLIWPRKRHYFFASLILLAYYSEAVDSASAFALNRIYTVVFFFLFLSPARSDNQYLGSTASVGIFRAIPLTIYFATGSAKVWGGNWLQYSDTLWSHFQGHYCTELCAFILRNSTSLIFQFMQYSVLVFEVGAPLWFLWKRTRPFAIIYGLIFHLSIALTMKAVWVFSLQLITFYVLFLEGTTIKQILERLQNSFKLITDRISSTQ